MRKIYLGLLLFLVLSSLVNAIPAGRYVATEDIKAEVLMGQTVAGTMLLQKGRQFQVTGEDRVFIQIELGQETKGRLPRSAEPKIALALTTSTQDAGQVVTATDASTPMPEKSVEAPSPKPEGALAIKGVYIGMTADDAVRVLNANKPLPLRVVYTLTVEEAVIYRLDYGMKDQSGQVVYWKGAGELYANFKTRKVTSMSIWGELSDLLFNTRDLSASSFAKQFIDSYGIPELKSVTVRGNSVWHYESPYGWSIYVSGDKTIDLFKTPTRQFD